MLPAAKRKEFVAAFGEARTREIEAELEAKQKEADQAGIEYKQQRRPVNHWDRPDALAGSWPAWLQTKAAKAGIANKEVNAWEIPPEVTTFEQYDAWRKGQDRAAQTMDLMAVFGQLVANGGSVEALAGEMAERVKKVKSASLKQRLHPAVNKLNLAVKELR